MPVHRRQTRYTEERTKILKPNLLHSQLKLYNVIQHQSQHCVAVLDKISISLKEPIKCADGKLQARSDPTSRASEAASSCDTQFLRTNRSYPEAALHSVLLCSNGDLDE